MEMTGCPTSGTAILDVRTLRTSIAETVRFFSPRSTRAKAAYTSDLRPRFSLRVLPRVLAGFEHSRDLLDVALCCLSCAVEVPAGVNLETANLHEIVGGECRQRQPMQAALTITDRIASAASMVCALSATRHNTLSNA